METKAKKMDVLSATIKALSAAIVQLNKDIVKMNKEVDDLTKRCEDEQASRDSNHDEYVILRDDLAAAISEAQEGIELLKSKKAPGQFVQEKLATMLLRIASKM